MTDRHHTPFRRPCRSRPRTWPRCAVAPLAAALALFVFGVGCGRRPTLTVTSEPPGAAVWADGELRGPTPQQIPLPAAAAAVRLRVVLPGYRDWEQEVQVAALPSSGGQIAARLEPRRAHALHCVSQPPGAEVFIDGESRGRTPLTVGGLEADSCEILFRAPAREPASVTVTFSGQPEPVTVTVTLKSLNEAYYLKQIADSANDLPAYVDLGHHYALEKRFADAAATLGKAIGRILSPPREDPHAYRLWSEVERIISEQFEFGGSDDLRVARVAMRDMLEQVLRQYGSACPAPLFQNLATVLAELDAHDRARAVVDQGRRQYPDDKALIQMAERIERRQGRR